jgi:flagellar hook protein FlgE
MDVDLDTGDDGYGMLGKGILTFNAASGAIEGVTFSKFIGDGPGMDIETDPSDSTSTSTVTLYHDLNTETIAATGTYTFTMDHTAGDAKTIGTDAISIDWTDGDVGGESGTFTIPDDYSAGSVLVDGTDYDLPDGMEFTFGAGALSGDDTFVAKILAGEANDLSSAYTWADISSTTEDEHLQDGYFTFNADFLGGTATDTSMDVKLDFGTNYSNSWIPSSLSTTQYSAGSTTVFQSASGYGAGDLQSITVGTDGVITGQYSNGQVLSLYRVALAKFQSTQGLYKVGGNLFRATRLSGDPITGKPGSSGLGSISPSSLEQSNVDIANEFVKMITTQRGFQANAKIITVTDQMLGELIGLKR